MQSMLKEYPWLAPYVLQLRQYLESERIPQALLLSGPEGIAKRLLARCFVQRLLCLNAVDMERCGTCQSCLLLESNTHPDLFVIKPEQDGQVVNVSQIRQLVDKMSLTPHFDAPRVAIIEKADQLNTSAFNSFLKFLEEPANGSCIILVTSHQEKLPATIKSRCQTIVFKRPERQTALQWLNEKKSMEQAETMLDLAFGSPLLALSMLEDKVLERRNDCFKGWYNLAVSDQDLIELAEKWKSLSQDECNHLIIWLIAWVMDMMKLSFQDQKTRLYQPDLAEKLLRLVQNVSYHDLYEHYQLLIDYHAKIDSQINKQLMFEDILIRWIKLNKV